MCYEPDGNLGKKTIANAMLKIQNINGKMIVESNDVIINYPISL